MMDVFVHFTSDVSMSTQTVLQLMSRLRCGFIALAVLAVSLATLISDRVGAQSDEAFDPLFSREVGPFDIATCPGCLLRRKLASSTLP